MKPEKLSIIDFTQDGRHLQSNIDEIPINLAKNQTCFTYNKNSQN